MSKQNLIYFLIVISLFLIGLDRFGLLSSVRDFADSFIIPIKSQIWKTRVNFGELTYVLTKYRELKERITVLEKTEKELAEVNLKYNLLKEENKKLRFQLESPLPPTYKFIPAQVLKSGTEMDIAAGLKSGVSEGMTVVDGTVILGRVLRVSNMRSIVVTLLNRETKIAVKTDRGASGVTIGAGETIIMENILQKDPLFLGDKVYTLGTDDFPANLLVGKIVHILGDDAAVYKQAVVEPLVDYRGLRYVFVISDL